MAQFQRLKSLDEFTGKEVFLYGVSVKKVLKVLPVIVRRDTVSQLISLDIGVKGFIRKKRIPLFSLELRYFFGIHKSMSLAGIKKYAKSHAVAVIVLSNSANDYNTIKSVLGEYVDLIVYQREFLALSRIKEIASLEKVSPEYRVGVLAAEADMLSKSGQINICKNMAERVSQLDNLINVVAFPKTGNTTLWQSIFNGVNPGLAGFESHVLRSIVPEVKEYLKGNRKKYRWIAGVREPIGCLISLMFELWASIYALLVDIPEYAYGGDCFNPNFLLHRLINYNMPHDKRRNTFLDWTFEQGMYNLDIMNFLDDEFLPVLGVDVYRNDFDWEKGYAIIEQNDVSLFIYRLEDMNSLEKEIGDFLGIEKFSLVKSNMAAEKWYAVYYGQYKKYDLKITRSDFEKLYNSKYMCHFYSEKEIAGFRQKWSWAIVEDEFALGG